MGGTINSVLLGLSGSSGSGSFVGTNSPSLTTPVLGVAAATSINFGGSSLNYYKSATSWTPVFTWSTVGNLSVSYTVQVGTYVKIGQLVFATWSLDFTPTYSTSSGHAIITGLPFTATEDAYTGMASYSTSDLPCIAPSAATGSFYLAASSSQMVMVNYGNLGDDAVYTLTSNLSSATRYGASGSIMYIA